VAGVKIIVRNNDGDLIQLANYLDREGWEVVQNAEEGAVGSSTLYLDDLDQSVYTTLGLNVGARRQIRLVDYTTNRIVHFGYTGARRIKRRYDIYGSPTSYAWAIDIWDPNTVINRRVLTHHGANRPRETDVERIQWLVTAVEWDIIGSNVIIGTGSAKTMSKADYRGQMVNDVISDCAQQANKNYWVDIVDDGAGDRLTFWYGKDNRDYYYSDVSISNDLADVDLTAINNATTTDVYPPWNDTEYEMNPDRVFTGVAIQWEKGLVYRHSHTGETQYERWDTVMQAPNVHEKDRAIERAENMLERLVDNGEDVRITSGILVAAADAHRVRAGMRIPVKLTHIPEMTDYVDCRILSRGLSPRADGYRYWIPLTLEPIEASAPATSCSTVVAAAVTALVETQAYAAGAVTLAITPTAGVNSVIFGSAHALNSNVPTDTAMHGTGSMTDMETGNVASGHPTAAHMYRAVAAAAGSYNVTAAYTGGYNAAVKSRWACVAAAIQLTGTTPVQSVGQIASTTNSFDLSSLPTSGNLLVMQITERNETNIDPDVDLTPGPGFWTKVVQGVATYTISTDISAIFIHCCDGTETIGPYGAAATSIINVSEWDV